MPTKLDYRHWNGTIPALTFCYHNRIDEAKARKLIKSLWNINADDKEFSHFLDYVKMVVNTSISSLKTFHRFANDKRFEYLDMLVVARDVHPNINSAIISGFDPSFNPTIVEVMTEKGICYAINAILAENLQSTQ